MARPTSDAVVAGVMAPDVALTQAKAARVVGCGKELIARGVARRDDPIPSFVMPGSSQRHIWLSELRAWTMRQPGARQ